MSTRFEYVSNRTSITKMLTSKWIIIGN
jgi:hypothetical protein